MRVRLLLDDNGTAGLDDAIAALDSHPGIEVRLFNPFVNRGFRALGYLTDFGRLNRRMHNKSFTADSQATIVGAATSATSTSAPATARSSRIWTWSPWHRGRGGRRVFDEYWSSGSAYPAGSILGPAGPDSMRTCRQRSPRCALPRRPSGTTMRSAGPGSSGAAGATLEWGFRRNWSMTNRRRSLGKARASEMLVTRLGEAIGQAERELDVISPYFVPGKEGARQLAP